MSARRTPPRAAVRQPESPRPPRGGLLDRAGKRYPFSAARWCSSGSEDLRPTRSGTRVRPRTGSSFMHRFRPALRLPLAVTLLLASAATAFAAVAPNRIPTLVDVPARRLPTDAERLTPIVPDLRAVPGSAALDPRLRLLGQSTVAQR